MSIQETLPTRSKPRGLAPRLRGLAWLVWRQQRAALWIGFGLVAVAACYIVLQRYGQHAYAHRHHIEGCQAFRACHGLPNGSGNPYDVALGHLETTYRDRLVETGRLLLAVPVLVGVFAGAPLLAREWEAGTHQLVWSQSVSRTRWLVAKLALPTVAVLVGSAALAAAYGWWWWPRRRQFGDVSWNTQVPFHAAGPSLVALSVLSLFVGATVGLLLRRTLPAMAVSLAVTVGVQAALDGLRPSLMPTRTFVTHGKDITLSPGAWWRANGYLTRSGRKIPFDRCDSATGAHGWQRCFTRLGVPAKPNSWVEYHPESQFWPMEWIEVGICLGATVVLAACCVCWFRRSSTTAGPSSS